MYGGIASSRCEGAVRARFVARRLVMLATDCGPGSGAPSVAHELRGQLAREDRLGAVRSGARRARRVTSTVSSPPSSRTVIGLAEPRAGRPPPRRRWRRSPRRASPPPRARRSAPAPSEPSTRMNETLVRFGNSSLCSISGPIAARSSSSSSSPDLDHALRVADRDVLEAPLAPARGRASRVPSRAAGGIVGGGQRGPAHRQRRRVAAPVIVGRISPALVRIENSSRVGPAARAQVEHRLAGAVARQLGLRAVRVEDPQLGDVARRRRPARAAGSPSEPTPKCGSQIRRTRSGVSSHGSVVALDDHVVVAERLPLLEPHRRSSACASARRACRTCEAETLPRKLAQLRVHELDLEPAEPARPDARLGDHLVADRLVVRARQAVRVEGGQPGGPQVDPAVDAMKTLVDQGLVSDELDHDVLVYGLGNLAAELAELGGQRDGIRALQRVAQGHEVEALEDRVQPLDQREVLASHRHSRRVGRRSARRRSPSPRSGAVDQLDARHLAHPGELAARVAPVGALHRLDVAGQELVEAERRARGARGARLGGRARLLGGAGGDHRVDPRVDPRRAARSRSIVRPTSSGRTAQLRRPELLAAAWRVDARALELESARAIRLRSFGWTARGDVGVELGVQRLAGRARRSRARPRRAPRPAPAAAGRGRRAPRAGRGRCRRRRSAGAPRPSSPSISACASSAKRPALNSSSPVDEADQPVLEPLPLVRRRGAAQDLEAPVDLDRVADDRHRVLAALAQRARRPRSRPPSCRPPVGPKIASTVHRAARPRG